MNECIHNETRSLWLSPKLYATCDMDYNPNKRKTTISDFAAFLCLAVISLIACSVSALVVYFQYKNNEPALMAAIICFVSFFSFIFYLLSAVETI